MRPRDLARLTGVSTDTLRHYERLGLLPAPPRTTGGYRQYSPAHVNRVQLIRRALTIGFSLADLEQVLRERDRGGAPCRRVFALVSERLSEIDREVAALVDLKRDLGAMLRDWERRLSGTPDSKQARLLDGLPRGLGDSARPRRSTTPRRSRSR